MRLLRRLIPALMFTSVPPQLAATETQRESPALAGTAAESVTLFDFSGAADEPGWSAVNDGVMGGVSRGGAKRVDGSLHFRGILSLENNGGFSSIRSGGPTRDLSAASVIVLRVRGDGRTYRLQLATNARFRGSRISYQAEFPTTRADWTEARVPLAALVPMFRGRTLSGPPLDRAQVEEIGLSLADGRPGAFALEIASIRVE
jgi:NADH dehydrogenase [ubiquinone] 1 alpha subcomplex assembly factor 1